MNEGKIIDIKDETTDVKTFKLDKKIEFIAGQYSLVSMGEEEKRPLTFSNSPGKVVEFTVKRMGEFTTKMHSLKVGNKLIFSDPRGEALNFLDSIKEDVVFIAGGSGITPFMSAIRFAIEKSLSNHITLFFSNRTVGDIIYKKELDSISNDNIKVIHTLSSDVPSDWNGETGRINKDMVEKYVQHREKKLWYVCAPPPMVKAMRQILEEMGIPKENLRIESWEIKGKHDEVK